MLLIAPGAYVDITANVVTLYLSVSLKRFDTVGWHQEEHLACKN